MDAMDRRAEVYGEAVERMVAAAVADPRVKALWLEGLDREELRPPYRTLRVHLAADEPDFEAVLAEVERIVAGGRPFEVESRTEVPRFARELRGVLDGVPIRVVLEKTPLLAKRRRLAVACLVDRTGHLYHVMDFSPPS